MHAFAHWQHDWEVETVQLAAMTQERLQKEIADKAALEGQVTKLMTEGANRRRQLRQGSGARTPAPDAGQLEREREARVQHLGQLGIKRPMNHKLSFGPAGRDVRGLCSPAQAPENGSKLSRQAEDGRRLEALAARLADRNGLRGIPIV